MYNFTIYIYIYIYTYVSRHNNMYILTHCPTPMHTEQ